MSRRKPPLEGMLYAKIKNFRSSMTNAGGTNPSNEAITTIIEDANVVTSLVAEHLPMHKPTIDIDFPVKVIESSTPGNSHLYIDKEMTPEDYFKLLRVMAEVGLVEPGFVDASEARGYTALRLPWVKKTESEMEDSRRKRAERDAAAPAVMPAVTLPARPMPSSGFLAYMDKDGRLRRWDEAAEPDADSWL